MSPLRQHVADYLTLRRALGYKLEAHEPLLNEFIDDLEQTGTSTVTIEAALACAMKPQGVQPYRWKQRLTVIRGFARYLHPMDPATQVPPSDLLAYRRRRPTPHVFCEEEIAGLVTAAGALAHPLRAATHRTLFGLLAATGMRGGEALRLDRSDVDLDAGDAFVGGFAAALARGTDPIEAARFGCAVAGISVTRPGTAPSMPRIAEVEALLAKR